MKALDARWHNRRMRRRGSIQALLWSVECTLVLKAAVPLLAVLYRIDRQWSAAFGIDNLNNDKYWNFHPYPQRSYVAELKFDL